LPIVFLSLAWLNKRRLKNDLFSNIDWNFYIKFSCILISLAISAGFLYGLMVMMNRKQVSHAWEAGQHWLFLSPAFILFVVYFFRAVYSISQKKVWWLINVNVGFLTVMALAWIRNYAAWILVTENHIGFIKILFP
jgi:hypothetical protein